MPCGRRPRHHPIFKTATNHGWGGARPGSGRKPRSPPPVIAVPPPAPAWFVVATHPKAERLAYASLHRAGFEAYLPLITSRRRDLTWHTQALFPGYLFVFLDLSRPWSPVRYAPGVYSLLDIDGIPTPCRNGDVEAVQAAVEAASLNSSSQASWAAGGLARIADGPFQGLDAIVTAAIGQNVTVAVLMLGQLRSIVLTPDRLLPRTD